MPSRADNDRERILRIIREIGMRPVQTRARPPALEPPRRQRGGPARHGQRDDAPANTSRWSARRCFSSNPGKPRKNSCGASTSGSKHRSSKGLPPVLSLRRYALRGQSGKAREWVVLDAHFVTSPASRASWTKHAAFVSRQLHRSMGRQALPRQHRHPGDSGLGRCFRRLHPASKRCSRRPRSGKNASVSGEQSVLAVSAAIGRW